MRKGLTTQQIIDKVQDGDYVGVTPCIPLTPEERARARLRGNARSLMPFAALVRPKRSRMPLLIAAIVAWLLLCAIAWSYLR
jgi:hypothetical protein